MSTTIIVSNSQRKPKLLGQTVIVIGGTARIGLETARRARTEGAKLILIGRNPETLQRAAREVDALSTTAFDATDPALVEQFFCNLPTPGPHSSSRMRRCGRPSRQLLSPFEHPKSRGIGEYETVAHSSPQRQQALIRTASSRPHLFGMPRSAYEALTAWLRLCLWNRAAIRVPQVDVDVTGQDLSSSWIGTGLVSD